MSWKAIAGGGVVSVLMLLSIDAGTLNAGESVPKGDGPPRRGVPKVYPPDEVAAGFSRVQLRSYIFLEGDPPRIVALRGKEDSGSKPAPGRGDGLGERFRSLLSRGGPGSGVLLRAMPGRLGGMPGAFGGDEDKEPDPYLIPINKLKGGERPAEQVRPVRLVAVAAAFPYRKQLEEFKNALRMRSLAEVRAEKATDSTAEKPLYAFRFLGVNVQRREVDLRGKPITEYRTLDLGADYRPYLVLTGRRFEPDDEKYQAISFPGLVMPRLLQIQESEGEDDLRRDRDPRVEDQLLGIQRTLRDLEGKTDPEIPEHCLVRVIDVTVRPGKTYEYRLQIRMANPNFGRKDVSSPTYAAEQELLSDWAAKKVQVKVDSELDYYAVDLANFHEGKRDYPYGRTEYRKDKVVMLQAHKWLERVPHRTEQWWIGDWAIAERFPCYRGEYIGRTERALVPYWLYTRAKFMLANDGNPKRPRPGIDVSFGYGSPDCSPPEAILVDFIPSRTGHDRVVKRSEDKVETKRVTADSAVEILMLSPEGKLLARNGAEDYFDPVRRNRYQEVRDRISDLKYRSR
jgi:hypothetical protein